MKDKEIIYIRVDANEQIAMGHLMRTLSIAEAIREEGGDCCFITADSQGHEKIRSRNFEVICLESAWNNLEQELGAMTALIKERNIRCILLDSYFVTPKYMDELSKITKLVYIDDIKAFNYSCAAIINYVIGETGEDYSYFEGALYMGAQYVPLRKEFSEVQTNALASELKKIMVTTGGADMYHFGKRFLEAILADERFEKYDITLVVGSKNADKEYLLDTYGEKSGVNILVDATNMSELMEAADCMVSAGGTTLYEACACKTPTISYSLADNQLTNVKRFDSLGALYYAGDIREGMSDVIQNILNRLQEMKTVQLRKDIAESMEKVVDGKGAYRIARILRDMVLEAK